MDSDKFPEKLKLRRFDGSEPVLEFGPGGDDIWQRRPYYLVPVPLENPGFNRDEVVEKVIAQAPEDVYVFCHGWHRNLYLAMQVYDRLIGRFIMLRLGGSIPIALEKSAFIGLAWNSDPTLDSLGFRDPLGRRDKAQFLRNAELHFDSSNQPTFRLDMLLVYEWLAYYAGVSASPDDVISDTAMGRLKTYPVIVTKQDVTWEERCTLLWKCYHEASPIVINNEQTEEPRATSKLLEPFVTVLNFAFTAAGGLALFTAVLGNDDIKNKLGQNILEAAQWVLQRIGRDKDDSLWYVALVVFAVSLLGLFLRSIFPGHSKGWAPITVLGYVIAQVVLAVPALAFLLVSYLFRTVTIPAGLLMLALRPTLQMDSDLAWTYVAWALIVMGGGWVAYCTSVDRPPAVFSEHIKKWGDEPLSIGEYLASLAAVPCVMIRNVLRPGHVVRTMATVLENQLAFFKMQRKAVKVGDQAAEFVSKIQAKLPNARVHLIGHSFGGSVVMNLARGLELRSTDAKKFAVQSLVTISGAYASNWPKRWLKGEGENVKGRIACLYSVNDSANMFYYPFANAGRMSAGYVGHVAPLREHSLADGTEIKGGLFGWKFVASRRKSGEPAVWKMTAEGSAAIVKPFNLMDRKVPTELDRHKYVNVDISRLAFQGPFALGKGHDDIFHSDIVHIVWSIMQSDPKSTKDSEEIAKAPADPTSRPLLP